MKKVTAALPLIAILALPIAASAHEHQVFEINGITYEFGIGSANEPIMVDDKSGVELQISKVGVVDGHEEHHHDESVEGAVEGLEKTLKVEITSGNARKTLDFVPAWSAPGYYNATYYPTEAGPLSYRIFGTVESIPFDVTFPCAAEHDMEGAEADTTRKDIAPGIVRVEQRGSFSCPHDKTDLGFPTKSPSLKDLGESGSTSRMIAFGSGVLSLLALGVAWRRRS